MISHSFSSGITLMVVALLCTATAADLKIYDADAGNPGSAAAIQSPVAQGWIQTGTGSGVVVAGVVRAGTNAWRISDDASGLNPSYASALSAAQLQQMYLGGWEFEMVVRPVRGAPTAGFGAWGVTVGNDPGWGLTDRERIGFSIERIAASDAFQVIPTHGGTVTLGQGSASSFHTIRCVGLPLSSRYEFFLDGVSQGVFDIKDGTSNANFEDVARFESGSTAGTGRETEWHSVRLLANDSPLVIMPSDGSTVVSEEGATSDSFTLRLARQPSDGVAVSVAEPATSADLDFAAGPGVGVVLNFSTSNWDTPQTVTVTAVDDLLEELDEVVIVRASATSGDPFFDGKSTSLGVTVIDNDVVDQKVIVRSAAFVSPKGAFVSDPGSYHTFRIPSLVVAPNGDLLAFAEGRRGTGSDPRTQANAPIDLVMKRSSDQGATWGNLVVIDPGFQGPPTNWLVDFADPTVVTDETTTPATMHLLYGQWPDSGAINSVPGNDPNPALDNHTVWVRSSTDSGATWSARTQILKPVGPGDSPDGLYWRTGEPGPGNGIQLRWQEGANSALQGRMVIPAKRSGSTTVGGSVTTEPFSYYSDDHGATWQVGNPTAGPDANEDEVVELTNGNVLLDARQNSGSFRRRHLSTDGGVNWGPDLGDDVPITAVDTSLDRYSARREGGERDRILFSGSLGTPAGSGSGRNNIGVWTSYDEGRSFINPVQLDEGYAAYSVVRRLPNGDIGVLVETDTDSGASYGKIEYFGFGLGVLEGAAHPAAMSHYDGFGNKIDRARGGVGWSGAWTGNATFTAVPANELGSASVGFDGFDRVRSFGRMDLIGAKAAVRNLSRGIDLGADGRGYVSLLVSRQLDTTANGAAGEELKIELRDSAGVARASFGVDSSEAFFVDDLGARQTGAAGGLALNQSYLLVLKIVAKAAGADQLLLKAYPSGGFGSGSVESDVAWTVSGDLSGESSALLDKIALVGGADSIWSIDEIRIGETWEAVAGEDLDKDGLDDAWEVKYFGSTGGSDGSGDADGDGMSDAEELLAGTNPVDGTSRFSTSIAPDGSGFRLSWPSKEGLRYRVEHSDDFLGFWMTEQAGIAATPPANVLPVPTAGRREFYRVVIE